MAIIDVIASTIALILLALIPVSYYYSEEDYETLYFSLTLSLDVPITAEDADKMFAHLQQASSRATVSRTSY